MTDQSGAVLPGVTVTATSPALQVPSVTDVTNERGEYRLAPLPVGVYQVTYDLSGFRPGQRQDVRLTVGFTAQIDVALGLATVAETVTVSGAAPVVDVTATSGASLFTKEVLDLTPTTRNGAMSLLTMAPGVRSFIDIGGSQTEENSGAKAFGQAGQVYYTIEGVMGNNWTNAGGSGAFWDFQAIDEARVQSMATDPEFPTRGVQINAIVKSGGNNFHGGGLYAVTGNKLQADNLDEELRDLASRAGNSVRMQNDISGDLGGRIIRNKLWFYGAVRYRDINRHGVGRLQRSRRLTETWTISSRRSTSRRNTRIRRTARTGSSSSTCGSTCAKMPRWTPNGPGKRAKTRPRRIPSSRGGGKASSATPSPPISSSGMRRTIRSRRSSIPGPPRRSGERTSIPGSSTARTSSAASGSRHFLHQTKGSVTYYKSNWAGGNHEFKVGGEYARNKNFRSLDLETGQLPASLPGRRRGTPMGDPFAVAFFNAPVYPDGRQNTTSFFGRDSWTIGRRLTLNLGVRYAHTIAFAPEQTRDAASGPSAVLFPAQTFPRVDLNTWNSFEPRLHAALDLSGDGKTVVKGGWGRYHHMRLLTPDVLNFVKNSIVYSIYQWRDPNGNNNYDAGEINLDPHGPDFIEQTGMEFDDLPPNFVNNPDEKQPQDR